jgi:type IV pilus assembly protein PilW
MGELAMMKIKGFSLIELMIALVIGLFLLSGLYSLFSGNQHSMSLMRSNGSIIYEGDKAMNIMKNYIQYAGYRDYSQITTQTYLSADNSVAANPWTNNQFIKGNNDITGVNTIKNSTDDLWIRYWGAGSTADNSIVSCSGAGVANTTVNKLHLYVDSSNNLTCFDTASNASSVIASGVENMQIRYLVQSGSSLVYRNAPLTDAESKAVARIEVGIVMAVDFDNSMNGATSYSIFGVSHAVASDHQLRQVYTNSILVRN